MHTRWTSVTAAFGRWLATIFVAAAGLQAQEPAELAGTWKRTKAGGEPAGSYRLTASNGGLEGELTDPEEGTTCLVKLAVSGGEMTGTATWKDLENNDQLEVRWEFKLEGSTKATGRCEWKKWDFYDDGAKVAESGWEDYTLERQVSRKIGLVTEGEDPGPVEAGMQVDDPAALVGGWLGPGGAWTLTISDKWIDLHPVGHQLAERVRMEKKRDRGGNQYLGGGATLANSQGCKVELALDSEGDLVGRASWREEGNPDESWSPVKFTQIPDTDSGEGLPGDEVPAPEAGETTSIAGDAGEVWKREDGLYLRLKPGAGKLEGELTDKEGNLKARVTLEEQGGLWVGRANWEGAEATWELSRSGDALTGRCEWLDAHEGQVIARGWVARSFKKLRRVM